MGGLDEAVAVMRRLREPGGCPWDAEQTHASLVTYLLEEAHELVEAIEAGSDDDVREELGDVLLQVLFHAEIARGDGRFDIDDVGRELAVKLRHRHPHVFGGAEVAGTDEVVANWDALKRAEKPHRESALDGIPATLPSLALAQKTLQRARRAGLVDDAASESMAEEQVGDALLHLVRQASAHGIDAERAMRQATRSLQDELRATERRASGVLPPLDAPASGWPVSAKAVVLHEGRCLLGRNDRDEWELLGGRVEPGETPTEAVLREVAEESGLAVRIDRPLLVEPFEPIEGRAVLVAAFACALVDDAVLTVSAEHREVAWHALDGLDDLCLPAIYRAAIALARDAA